MSVYVLEVKRSAGNTIEGIFSTYNKAIEYIENHPYFNGIYGFSLTEKIVDN